MKNFFFKKTKDITAVQGLDKFHTKDDFMFDFFAKPHHAWILKETAYMRAFETILCSLDFETIKQLWSIRDLAFIKAQGTLSCAIDSEEHLSFILCYPELLQLLRSGSPDIGIAILFHELGHIYHRHNQKKIDTLLAQFEADEFALFHGFGEDIISVINDYRHLEDNRKRIQNIQFKMKSRTIV
jgi:hypothetical protein